MGKSEHELESAKARQIAAEPRRATMTPSEWAKHREAIKSPFSREAIRRARLEVFGNDD